MTDQTALPLSVPATFTLIAVVTLAGAPVVAGSLWAAAMLALANAVVDRVKN